MSRYGSYHGSTYAATTATAIPAFREPFQPLVPGFVALPNRCGLCGKCSFDETCVEHCIATRPRSSSEKARTPLRPSLRSRYRSPEPSRFQATTTGPSFVSCVTDTESADRRRSRHRFRPYRRLFGCEHWDVKPDIMTMAKGLTSGYIPMGAAAVSRKVSKLSRARRYARQHICGSPGGMRGGARDLENHRRRESGRECRCIASPSCERGLSAQK